MKTKYNKTRFAKIIAKYNWAISTDELYDIVRLITLNEKYSRANYYKVNAFNNAVDRISYFIDIISSEHNISLYEAAVKMNNMLERIPTGCYLLKGNTEYYKIVFGEKSKVYLDKLNTNKSCASCNLEMFMKRNGITDLDEGKEKFRLTYSTFSVESIMHRHGVSEADAIKIQTERVNKGLETLQSKPQEELDRIHLLKGVSEEAFKIRFGDDWAIHYKIALDKRKGRGSLQWYINKYGEENGKHLYKTVRCDPSKIYATYEWWMKTYGVSEDKAKIMCRHALIQRESFSLDYCKRKYGFNKGYDIWKARQELWQESLYNKPQEEIDRINADKSLSLDTYVRKYGYEEGLTRYNKSRDSLANASRNPGSVSKECSRFFSKLLVRLARSGVRLTRDKYLVGLSGSKELALKTIIDDKHTYRFYDFAILDIGLIIEYNGIRWHPRTRDEWKLDMCFDEALVYDNNKKLLAESYGFEVIYVWSDDDLEQKLNELTQIIINRYEDI